jgi:hypothetical protein
MPVYQTRHLPRCKCTTRSIVAPVKNVPNSPDHSISINDGDSIWCTDSFAIIDALGNN